MNLPPIVSPEQWGAARAELLVKEKELTHTRDRMAAERRRMPRLAVETPYRFIGSEGEMSLVDLFQGRRQLILYRFFFEEGVEGWPDAGCTGCSWLADQFTHPAHLNAHDVTFALISRAPQPEIGRMKRRMAWEHLPWHTLTDDFDTDFDVGQMHGTNVFLRDGDQVFRTYFVNGRGDEVLGGLWTFLDITPFGRQELWEDSPEGYPQHPQNTWVRRHDEYTADELHPAGGREATA